MWELHEEDVENDDEDDDNNGDDDLEDNKNADDEIDLKFATVCIAWEGCRALAEYMNGAGGAAIMITMA